MERHCSTDNLEQLTYQIDTLSLDSTANNPYIVSICGPSASGKSTVSKKIQGLLTDSSVVEMDRYLSEGLWDSTRKFNHDSPDPKNPYIGGISPEIWDMSLMEKQLNSIARGNSVDLPVFSQSVKDRIGYEAYSPTQRIILEGGHSFSTPFLELSDYKLLVEAQLHDRLVRKLFRTCVQYGLSEGDEVVSRYLQRDEPVHRHYLPVRRSQADAIVTNPIQPAREFGNLQTGDPYADMPYSELLPHSSTGNLLPEERVRLVEATGHAVLAYYFKSNLVVDTPITEETRTLLGMHYSEKDTRT